MIEITCRRFQAIGDVPDGVAARKLTENHADKLTPCVVAFTMFVRSRVSEVKNESKESSILNFVNSRNNITFACEELFECMVL